MNKEVEKLLNEQSLYCYDLLDETMSKLKNKAPLDKYIEYKRNGNTYDPDSNSNILQEIYKLLWGELCSQWFMKKDDGMICSDNMTSAQNFVNQAMKKENYFEEFPECKGTNQKNYSKQFMINVYNKHKNELTELFNEYNLNTLIRVYHTIGNYCPVPRFFNSARAGYMNADYDFWDLTLMKIKEYYDAERDPKEESRIIYDELFKTKKNPLPCKAWLDYFGSWESFVDRNYFGSFVDDDYNVIPFWEGHIWKGHSRKKIGLPEDKGKFTEAVEGIKQRITSRGQEIESRLWEMIK
ncbi:MAG: hypothetical protein IJ871_07980 [Ruminococcus sp.]|nr:hypothetical protein [Ruminococcus sp.]